MREGLGQRMGAALHKECFVFLNKAPERNMRGEPYDLDPDFR